MATDTTQEPSPSPAPTVAMGLQEADTKMVAATGHGDCQKLKDLVRQQDPTTMLVVMASSKPEASPNNSSRVSMQSENHSQSQGRSEPGTASGSSEAGVTGILKRCICMAVISNFFGRNHISTPNLSQEFLDQATAYNCGNSTNNTNSSPMGQATAGDVEQGSALPLSLNGVTVEGDTVLHLLAASGEEQNFLDCATFIHGLEEGLLLSKQNNNDDTPLHCAARAGRTKMVSHLITLALPKDDRILLEQTLRENYNTVLEQVLTTDNNRRIVEQLLREENNRKETVLHEAVRIGDNELVINLLMADPELACFPKDEGTSPLYLAISLGRAETAQTLLDESKNKVLSYAGPDGQNALHAAVLRGPVLTQKVLEWNKDLTTARDSNGSTPLHFAASLVKEGPFAKVLEPLFAQVLEANTAAIYQPDNDGLYPIHVAASVGAKHAIALIVEKCGSSSAGLRDSKGRTFLHVAVGKKQLEVVKYTCGNRSLAWILNMQDNDGNTALHLAVQAGSLRMFCTLFGDRHVNLNLANTKGETPLDIAHYKIPPGLFNNQNSEARIRWALNLVGAMRGTCRKDHLRENYEQIHGSQIERDKKDMENVKDSTQALCIGSVLIATVAFGATFALPGGYRADDHTNAGTPTLVGRYAFDAFVMANTLAFILSSLATIMLIRSGSPYFNIRSRRVYSGIAYYLVYTSVICLVAAFALAVCAVLGSIARNTAIAVCVLSVIVAICNNAKLWLNWIILTGPLFIRYGTIPSLVLCTRALVQVMLVTFWPFLVIFLWAAYGRSHPTGMLESPAPAPASSS